jgi:hypothetical protein
MLTAGNISATGMIRMAKNINYKKLVLYEGDAKY